MKVVINKSRAAARKQTVISEIMNQARKCADEGLNSFTYHFKEGDRDSFPPPMINISISKISEGTVECGYRSDYGSHVKYFIKENKLISNNTIAEFNTLENYKNIKENYTNNKLIAEFMELPTQYNNLPPMNFESLAYFVGGHIKADNSKNENLDDVFHPDDMKFSEEWDWLIPAVSKCRSESHSEDIIRYWEAIYYSLEDCDMAATYRYVVEFIKMKKTK